MAGVRQHGLSRSGGLHVRRVHGSAAVELLVIAVLHGQAGRAGTLERLAVGAIFIGAEKCVHSADAGEAGP